MGFPEFTVALYVQLYPMQGLVGETCSLGGFRRHSALTCIQRGSTEVKKVLLAKSQHQGKIRLHMADCSPGCQISPQADIGLRESFEGRDKNSLYPVKAIPRSVLFSLLQNL